MRRCVCGLCKVFPLLTGYPPSYYRYFIPQGACVFIRAVLPALSPYSGTLTFSIINKITNGLHTMSPIILLRVCEIAGLTDYCLFCFFGGGDIRCVFGAEYPRWPPVNNLTAPVM